MGAVRKSPIHSICVHGDNTEAVYTARALRAALTADEYDMVILPEVV